MPVRILHVSTRLILGGSQENTVLSCEGQARLGHEVHLAFGPIYGPEGSLLARMQAFNARCVQGLERCANGAAAQPVGVHVVPDLIRQINPRRDARCYRQTARLIGSLRPDVVHTHSSKAGIIGRAAAWNATPRPAVVHTIHGPPFMPVEGGMLQRLKRRAINRAYALSEKFVAARCHKVLSVAGAMTEQFLARGIGTPGLYETVYSGMEVERYLPPSDVVERRAALRARLGIDGQDLVFVTVARLSEHKGHDDLLSALGDTLRHNPTWKLLWVGDGWWRGRLIERARAMGLMVREADALGDGGGDSGGDGGGDGGAAGRTSSIVLTGLVPSERVAEHLWASDVLVHPSAREGLPRTVPQGLLAGLPAVAYDVDGTGEACITGQTGVLVPAGNVQQLRAALLGLASDAGQRQRLAQTGRAMCIDRFSTQRMVSELERVYAQARAIAQAQAQV